MVDWEVELAVVIGKTGYNIPVESAMEHVFGYTVAQDVSARDWQKKKNGGQFLLGKTMDTFCPLGPAVVTAESVPDVYNLSITSKVNGALKQNGNTSELIHRIDYVISRISRYNMKIYRACFLRLIQAELSLAPYRNYSGLTRPCLDPSEGLQWMKGLFTNIISTFFR